MPRQTRNTKQPKVSKRSKKTQKKSKPQKRQPPPLYFWKETEDAGGFLAPWYTSPFKEGGHKFLSVGHWVTAEKARLFGDEDALKRVRKATDMDTIRSIGANIKNFDEQVWEKESLRLAERGNILKFGFASGGVTNVSLRERLKATGDRELIDASPHDRLWGIGYTAASARRVGREKWGENLYGKAVMAARRHVIWMDDPASTAPFDTPGSGLTIYW